MKSTLFATLFFLFGFYYQTQAQIILDKDSSLIITTQEINIIETDSARLQKLIKLCENCYQQMTSSQIKYQPNDRCLAYYAYGSQLLALAEKMGDNEGKIIGSFYKGLEMELRNKEAEAEKLYLQWYYLRKKEQKVTKNSLKLRWVYDYLSQFYMRTLQLEKTEKILKIWYSEAIKQKNEKWTHHHVARKLGNFYCQIGEYEKAASFFELAIDENAFTMSEYIVEMGKISEQLIADGYVKQAIKLDNNFLERLKKENQLLYETHLRNCIINREAGEIYQLFFLEKFYKYFTIKHKQKEIEVMQVYKSLNYLALLPKNLQKEDIKTWLLYVDKNVSSMQSQHTEYSILFAMLSYNVGFEIEFQAIWEEVLPRIEKIDYDKIATKQKIYDRIINILQNKLVKKNYQATVKRSKTHYNDANDKKFVRLFLRNIEKLQNKPKKDESDEEFLLAVQKELNFARKIKGYNFWGR